MSFLSFSTTDTLAKAIRTVQQAKDRMAQFQLDAQSAPSDATATTAASAAAATSEEEEKSATSETNMHDVEEGDQDSDDAEEEATATSAAAADSNMQPTVDLTEEDDATVVAGVNGAVNGSAVDPSSESTSQQAALTTSSTASASNTSTSSSTFSRKRKHDDADDDEATIDKEDQHQQQTAQAEEAGDEDSQEDEDDDMDTSDSHDNATAVAGSSSANKPPPSCQHYQSRGPAYASCSSTLRSYDDLASTNSLARTWPFSLDPFQRKSIEVLEHGRHLLVAAHTSAGKTLVAEYAIEMVRRENARKMEASRLQAAGSHAASIASSLPPTLRRAIYTAPIKALSNQKFREFSEVWSAPGEVGLMTGDVILNPNATILIMTTEILRAMLYDGSETLETVDAVIFDEVHYMRDNERGIIWEESIIMLPSHIQCIFLSATLENAQEFAEWIHDMKAQRRKEEEVGRSGGGGSSSLSSSSSSSSTPLSIYDSCHCHVVYTSYRPTPLVHYLYLKGGGQGLYQIKNDARGEGLIMSNLVKVRDEAMRLENEKKQKSKELSDLIRQQHVMERNGSAGSSGYNSHPSTPTHSNSNSSTNAQLAQRIQTQLTASRTAKRNEIPDLVRLITLALEQDWLPLIVFSFSRRECEHLSLVLGEKRWALDLTSDEEKSAIALIWKHGLSSLSEEDKKLPQLEYLLPLLMKGIGVHHSGLLPILKEIIEILFQENLLKVLCATETFSIGLNLPSKAIIFTTLEKFDGRSTRYLLSQEYTQMSGRAGRRGKDEKGIVIAMVGVKELEAEGTNVVSTTTAASSSSSSSSSPLGGMLSQIMHASSEPLCSKFRLTYNMILNLIRASSSFDPTYILSKSFLHFQQMWLGRWKEERSGTATLSSSSTSAPLTTVSSKRSRMGEGGISSSALQAGGSDLLLKQSEAKSGMMDITERLKEVEDEITKCGLDEKEQRDVREYQTKYEQLKTQQQQQYHYSLRHPLSTILPFLQPGRLVYIVQPAVAETNTTAQMDARPGREEVKWGWGVVVHWRKRHAVSAIVAASGTASSSSSSASSSSSVNASSSSSSSLPAEYVVDILLPVGLHAKDGALTEHVLKWGDVNVPMPDLTRRGPGVWENGLLDVAGRDEKQQANRNTPLYHILNCSLTMIHSISSIRIYLPPSLLLRPAPGEPDPQQLRHALFQVVEKCAAGFEKQVLPKIKPAEWIGIQKGSTAIAVEMNKEDRQMLRKLQTQLEETERFLHTSSIHTHSLTTIQSYLKLHALHTQLSSSMQSHTSTLSTTYLTSYRIELHTRLRILRRFKLLNSDSLITSKGRIACEIECTDELLVTEFIYEGYWKSLSVNEFVAMLAAFLETEKSNADKLMIPTQPLKDAYNNLLTLARKVSEVSNECGLVLDTQKYVGSFKQDLIPIVYKWMTMADGDEKDGSSTGNSENKSSFAVLLTMSNLFEGSLIRLFRRLDELLNQLIKAGKNIGEESLVQMLEEGQKKMKRGIMFVGSLYI